MPIYYINTGSSANKGDGDNLRTAFTKVNANFASINSLLGNASTSTQAKIIVSAFPPNNPVEGDVWWDVDTGNSYVYYTDMDTGQWVSLSGPIGGNFGSSSGGNFRIDPHNVQANNYTIVADDIGAQIVHPSTDTNARTYTIPSNASVPFPPGTKITFVNDSTQTVSINVVSDVLRLVGEGSTGTRTLAQYGEAVVRKIATTTWYISGVGLS